MLHDSKRRTAPRFLRENAKAKRKIESAQPLEASRYNRRMLSYNGDSR
jgi:hypothetical protein